MSTPPLPHDSSGLRDPLTGLPSAALFRDRLEQAILRQTRQKEGLAVIALSPLEAGQPVDDPFLRELARNLSHNLRATDTVSHRGSGHFVILLMDITSVVDATSVAQRLLTALSQSAQSRERKAQLRPCAGVAFSRFCGAQVSADGLVEEAEEALRGATQRGGNPLQVVAPHEHGQAG